MSDSEQTGVAVSAILGVLWAWIALAYHLAFFSRISPAAYGFAAVSAAGAVVFIWQGVVQRRLTFLWAPGPKAAAGVVLIAAGVVGVALLLPLGRPLRIRTS